MKPRYYTIDEMTAMIEDPNRSLCRKLFDDHRELFHAVPGAAHNHQVWPGGYLDHVQEVMNIAIVLYKRLNVLRSLPFSLSDALLVLFLHDVEKPWKYELGPDNQLRVKSSLQTKAAQHEFRNQKLNKYGIALTPEQENGMKYVEGEFNDYTNLRRVMGPLAAFCHLCDVTSARIWFDHPFSVNDPWSGAQRFRK